MTNIPIHGDADFVRKVSEALRLARRAPNAHLLSGLRSIHQGNPDGIWGAASWGGGQITIDQAQRYPDPRYLAGVLIHEACHAYHGDEKLGSTPETEYRATEAENIARASFGLGKIRDEATASAWHGGGSVASPASHYTAAPAAPAQPQPPRRRRLLCI